MNISSASLDLSKFTNTRPRAAQLTTSQNLNHFIVVTLDHKVVAIDEDGKSCFEAELPDSMRTENLLDIHCYGTFVAVVECRGLNGIVYRLDQPEWRMELSRKDYHCNNCTWGIGFFERDDKVHMIHATRWNGLDITCLESAQCLTSREIDYETQLNYLDFFHSRLHISPDQKHFISNGWVWAPYDVMYLWSIDNFLKTFEKGHVNLSALERNGYNWDRPCCFVDNETIAWGYNAREAGSDVAPDDQPTELVFQNIHDQQIVRRIGFENFDLTSEKEAYGRLWYDFQNKLYVCSSNRHSSTELVVQPRGTTIADADGSEVWRSSQTAEFVSTDQNLIGFLVDSRLELVQYGA